MAAKNHPKSTHHSTQSAENRKKQRKAKLIENIKNGKKKSSETKSYRNNERISRAWHEWSLQADIVGLRHCQIEIDWRREAQRGLQSHERGRGIILQTVSQIQSEREKKEVNEKHCR
jgi:hypothetical protein